MPSPHPNVVVVIGGGLAGLSAAHTVLQSGGRVVLIDKASFCGGNSTKATSGINGALTKTQIKQSIPDSPEIFEADTIKGGSENPHLAKVLTHNSGDAVNWLMDDFDLDLSLVSRLGGHSHPRTHRGKERFPGMTITYALMEKFEEICESTPTVAKMLLKTRVESLSKHGNKINGVYVSDLSSKSPKKSFVPADAVIIATGGFGADYSKNSILAKVRPDLLHLPTTNGDHCTGDGIKMAQAISAKSIDLEWVQVHPTGLVKPDDPDAQLKFLAAEALRGVGGILIDRDGNRFCNELGRRDYVTGEMWKNGKPPFRLVLNGAASKEIAWHCKHYKGRGLMKYYPNGELLAADMKIDSAKLTDTFRKYSEVASLQLDANEGKINVGKFDAYPSGKTYDEFGKKFFTNVPLTVDDEYHVAIVTPVIHYCMGGLKTDVNASVIGQGDLPIAGLYGAGEVLGGIHGKNRLGGNSLLDCVVFGRVAGKSACKFMLRGDESGYSKL